jgi:hypothetical protein
VSCAHIGNACEELGHQIVVTWPPRVHRSLTQDFWMNADVNDAIECFNKFYRTIFLFEMNVRADGLSYVPFFAAHWYLVCRSNNRKRFWSPTGQ